MLCDQTDFQLSITPYNLIRVDDKFFETMDLDNDNCSIIK